ncbi:MAG: hypothetical protein IKC48_04830 [Clostridia bacterium]|nr:hypothetical protein [Clostridia bacterium]
MKKTISIALAACMLIMCMFALTSCSGLSGTYENEILGTKTTYKFGAFGKYTMTVDATFGEDEVVEGKYEISDDGNEIIFIYEDKDGEEIRIPMPFEKGDGYIKIMGVEYKKK